ncbi:MAG: tRNA pseudouridine(55) synthase TruB [Steroidobacteraceae bacterium]|nr:tRNA pseudouridine(55) synthase TruB [Steroidobacteraceae bacterium]
MPNGILLLDKPTGLTSNGALQRVRRAFNASSAGHVGTLDPMATGMLPLCLDEATKVIAEIESGAKAYEFTIKLGLRTNTGDADGAIVEEAPVPTLDVTTVERVLGGFLGVQQQVPPMYSALKREGRPLYELARKGIEVERAARTIVIRELTLVQLGTTTVDLSCECAKGTYIRVLGEDIARVLGTLGHLTKLRRPWVEPFRGMPMVTLEAALEGAATGQGLLPPDAALQSVPRATLDESQVSAVRHGQAIHCDSDPRAEVGRRVRLYGPDSAFLGLAEVLPEGRLQPRRLFLPSAT